ncbi:hypothetical protein [Acinetobacter sp. c1-l78]|uniref:hypothetical protein n=1 Tax=Acinetobacter sp. c1-l78 TaxID=3342803 RepID=UPI0035B81031
MKNHQITKSPNQQLKFYKDNNCQQYEFCQVYYQLDKQPLKKFLALKYPEDIIWHDNSAQIHFSVGSYTSTDFFIDAQKGIYSRDNVILFDAKNQCVLAQYGDKGLAFYRLHQNKPVHILNLVKLGFDKNASFVLSAINSDDTLTYVKNGNFIVNYEHQKQGQVSKTFTQPCQ